MNWITRNARVRLISAIVCCVFLAQSVLAAQSDLGLRILVVEGAGAQNVIGQANPAVITVRIVDRNNRPVPDATVVFTAPANGPSGGFLNGSNSIILFTDPQGRAVAQDYQPNGTPGSYDIQVRASYMAESVSATIRQTNIAAKKSYTKMIAIVAAAGGALGLVLAAGGGGSNGGSNPSGGGPTITPGGTTVDPPR